MPALKGWKYSNVTITEETSGGMFSFGWPFLCGKARLIHCTLSGTNILNPISKFLSCRYRVIEEKQDNDLLLLLPEY